jgi:hypothetical protein
MDVFCAAPISVFLTVSELGNAPKKGSIRCITLWHIELPRYYY